MTRRAIQCSDLRKRSERDLFGLRQPKLQCPLAGSITLLFVVVGTQPTGSIQKERPSGRSFRLRRPRRAGKRPLLCSCAVAVLPATLCWGASFPFAFAAASRGSDAAKATAAVYAANTVGAIAGALGFSMILFPDLGPQRAEQCLIGISAVGSLLMFVPPPQSLLAGSPDPHMRHTAAIAKATKMAAWSVGVAFLICNVPDIPGKLIAGGRDLLRAQTTQVLYRGDGRVLVGSRYRIQFGSVLSCQRKNRGLDDPRRHAAATAAVAYQHCNSPSLARFLWLALAPASRQEPSSSIPKSSALSYARLSRSFPLMSARISARQITTYCTIPE